MEINGDGRRKLVKEFISHVHDGSMCRYPVSFGKGEKELMLRKLTCVSVVLMVIMLGMTVFARADSQETVECTPEDGDIKSSEAYELAKQALFNRFDLDVADMPWEAHFVSYSGFFGHVDEEPIWLVSFGLEDERPNSPFVAVYYAAMDRTGKMIGVNGGGRDIDWDSDTLSSSKMIDPISADGTKEEAEGKAWEMLLDIETPWGDDPSGITADAELIVNENFCLGSEPVWLVTFSKEGDPIYKVLLRWDMEFIANANWDQEFLSEGMPKWVEQKDLYYPHGVTNFGSWSQEEQAEFSVRYRPIVAKMELENPHLADPFNEMYWLTRHVYGIPSNNMISLDQAKRIAKDTCINHGAKEISYDTRLIEAALDITDFEKPIWRMLIGYDFETMRAGSDLWERIILRINAYTGEVIEIRQPSTDIGYLYIAEIW